MDGELGCAVAVRLRALTCRLPKHCSGGPVRRPRWSRHLGKGVRGSFFFFFQAEDGIRDLTVTGVQTCALPIYVAARGFFIERGAEFAPIEKPLLELGDVGARPGFEPVEQRRNLRPIAEVDCAGKDRKSVV